MLKMYILACHRTREKHNPRSLLCGVWVPISVVNRQHLESPQDRYCMRFNNTQTSGQLPVPGHSMTVLLILLPYIVSSIQVGAPRMDCSSATARTICLQSQQNSSPLVTLFHSLGVPRPPVSWKEKRPSRVREVPLRLKTSSRKICSTGHKRGTAPHGTCTISRGCTAHHVSLSQYMFQTPATHVGQQVLSTRDRIPGHGRRSPGTGRAGGPALVLVMTSCFEGWAKISISAGPSASLLCHVPCTAQSATYTSLLHRSS